MRSSITRWGPFLPFSFPKPLQSDTVMPGKPGISCRVLVTADSLNGWMIAFTSFIFYSSVSFLLNTLYDLKFYSFFFEPPVESREDDQGQKGRCDKPADDHRSQWFLNL